MTKTIILTGICVVASFALTYRVGPSRPDTSLQMVAGLLNPGDTVLVDGDHTYPGGLTFRRPGEADRRIVVKGVRINNRRPVISGVNANGDVVHFRTDDPFSGPGADHYTFEGFEVTGATNRGIFQQGDDNLFRDLLVHHCMHGILGADQGSGSCTLEYSELYANGSGDRYHQVYMATDEVHYPGSVFRMRFCYIHDGAGGNNVKSRAERNEIFYNWIEGAYYHELELIGPDGGDAGDTRLKREDSDVLGNVLFKKRNFAVARIGGDGTGESHGRYRFVNNTVVCSTSAVFRIFDSLESVEMHNNVFFRLDGGAVQVTRTVEAAWTEGVRKVAGSNNWIPTDATNVPPEWTGTITGVSPGLESPATGALTPQSGSPLVNAGNIAPSGVPGYAFPSPAFPPVYHPPEGVLSAPDAAFSRPAAARLDIGAFEYSANRIELTSEKATSFYCPSPFLPGQAIRFSIRHGGHARIWVVDAAGRTVVVLADRIFAQGNNSLTWDGSNLAQGVYFCVMRAQGGLEAARFVLFR